ncbi:hypothetical protein FUAX_16180 [Fulvitalea axinellae]|uniref:Aerotolerance regulator N-terminal domain-containing protein n=1 Tax=Fulvitalea axinellae TaxID=1182444 RepID=A0AAU9CAJ8_9BACT|nr:hypothetical protein FUAX_16180 [Fulvitalea axinellae]
MEVVNPLLLTALAAVAIPIIIHLMRQRKLKNAYLGTLRFLKLATKSNGYRNNITKWLLLALRCLAVVLLVALFSRPFLSEYDSIKPDDRYFIILVDISASMNGQYGGDPVFENFWKKIKKKKKELTGKGQVEIALFADEVTPWTSEKMPELTHASADFENALRWASERLVFSGKKDLRIFLYSDLQKSNLPEEEVNAVDERITVEVLDGTMTEGENLALSTDAVRNLHKGMPVKLKARISTDGGDVERTAIFYIDGKRVGEAKDTLGQFELSWKPQKEGSLRLRVELEKDDAYPFDNIAYGILNVTANNNVLIVDGSKSGSKHAKASYFLEKALAVDRGSNSTFGIKKSDKPSFKSGEFNAVALCGVSSFNTAGYSEFLKTGGNIVVFLDEKSDLDFYNGLFEKGLFPVKLNGLRLPAKPVSVSGFNKSNPLLGSFGERISANAGSLVMADLFSVQLSEKATDLAMLDGGSPIISSISVGKGKVIAIANPATRRHTDWPVSRMFVPLVRELFGGLSEGNEKRSLYRLEASMGTYERSGIFGGAEGDTLVTVPVAESVKGAVSPEFFMEYMNIENPEIRPAQALMLPSPEGHQRKQEWFHWIALVLLGLLALESVVAYRHS